MGGPLDRAWTATALGLTAIVPLIARMTTTDLAYHIRVGEDILRTRAIPTVDTYTFTVRGVRWQDQQWGSDVLIALLHRLGGWPTLVASRALLTCATFTFVFLACRARGAAPRAAALLTVGGFIVAMLALTMRPHLFALPLLGATLWLLADRERRPRGVWIIPVLAALAVNLHGSFVLLPLLIGLAYVEEHQRGGDQTARLILVFGATVAATLVNPFGFRAWTYAADLATDPVIQRSITEWQPLNVREVPGILAFGAAIAVIGFLARRREAADWSTLFALGLFLWLALASQRNIGVWGIVAPVAIAGLLPVSDHRGQARGGFAPARALGAGIVILIIVLLPWWRPNQPRSLLADVPWDLTDAARHELSPGTRTLVHQPWGSWFLYAAPELPIFLDSRIEILPLDVWQDYQAVAFAGAAWEESLARWDVQAIVAKNGWDLLPMLREAPDWHVAFQDADGMLFVRR